MEKAEEIKLSNQEFFRSFNRKAAELRIPLTGSLELTHRCNLRCVHCYFGRQHHPASAEMETGEVLSAIDEMAEAGCLYLLITGGEPLLRPDFPTIYRHAKERGLLVSIFTNGTLVTGEITDLFTGLPPRSVEITLYGSTAATYEKITGVAGSHGKCLEGIKRLMENRVNLQLKTILMTLNTHEFHDMETIAEDLGVKFRLDAAIFPRKDGDMAPLSLRVPPEEAIEKEFSSGERERQWRDYRQKTRGLKLSEKLYSCGAGVTGFHVDPYGGLRPCLMIDSVRYDLNRGAFQDGWREISSRIEARKVGQAYQCRGCDKWQLCGFCPAFFQLETGSEETRSEFLCAMGDKRFQIMEYGDLSREKNAK